MAGTIKEPRRGILTVKSLAMSDTVAEAGHFTEIGCYTVSAGMAVEIGYGWKKGQDEAEGRIYMDLRDNAVAPGGEVNGIVRIELLDAQKRPLETLFESRTELLRQGVNDRTKQISLAETDAVARENKNIVVQIMPDNNVTVGSANSKILIDSTTYTDEKPVQII